MRAVVKGQQQQPQQQQQQHQEETDKSFSWEMMEKKLDKSYFLVF